MSETVSFPKLGLDFNIDPVAFKIGDFPIYWYGIIISLGMILAISYVFKRSRSFGIDSDKLLDVIIVGIFGGIIGARLYYVIFSWSSFKDDLGSIFSIRSGGLAIYGGIIGAVLAGVLICKLRKIKIIPILDIVGLGFFIGQAIGRWGNFFNIEAFGCNTELPWGMTSPSITTYLAEQSSKLADLGVTINTAAPVHPTFLYESLWCALGFVLLHLYSKRRKFDGEVFLMYLAWYGAGRFFIEGLRVDSLLIGRIRASQLLAFLLVVAAIITILVVRSKIKRSGDPDYLKLYVDTEESKANLAEIDNKKNNKREEK